MKFQTDLIETEPSGANWTELSQPNWTERGSRRVGLGREAGWDARNTHVALLTMCRGAGGGEGKERHNFNKESISICRPATLKRFTVTVKRQHATMLPELPWCSSNSVKDNRRRSRKFLEMNINLQYTERRALNRWRSIHHLKTTVGTLSVTRHPTDRISELTRNNVDELNPLKWRACLVHLPRGCRSATIRSPPEGLAKVW